MFFKNKRLFHSCNYNITDRSNVLQLDEMGYPLRLCIVKCPICGKTDQMWLDTNVDELKNPNNVILKWSPVK